MQLKTLLSKLTITGTEGATDRPIDSLCYDSRRAQENSLFIALRGEKVDGHHYIDQAIANGATAVLVEEPVFVSSKVTRIIVPDTRAAMADAACAFYRDPALRLKTAGVTGTNGKTTTTFLLKHICEKAFWRCGLIGTVRYEIADRVLPAPRTTPESLETQEMLFQMENAGCKAVAMEVSSHALMQERVRGIEFDVAIFTNLTQDHLDYHKTMDEYFAAKSRLFTGLADQKKKKGTAVVNIDDRYGMQLLQRLEREGIKTITYGVNARADFRASSFKSDFSGTSFQLDAKDRSFLVRLPMIGRFNVYNSLAALAGASALGLGARESVLALSKAPAAPGRLEPVPGGKRSFQVYVDYAHTDDALLNVVKTLRELNPARLIVVFGCGGNRDAAKRPKMGAVADEYADWSIITSDNPRKERPAAILEDIRQGFRSNRYEIIEDRKEAINRAIALAEPRDIVLIAGKGHETYQEFADHTIPFDDVQVARSAMESKPVDRPDRPY